MAAETSGPPDECSRCGAAVLAGARFCVQCGASTTMSGEGGPAPAPERTDPSEDGQDGARLVECEECGASNAASRALCARCNTPLREEVPGGDALPDPAPAPPTDPARRRGSDTNPVLLSLVLLAGLVVAGVLLALVTSAVTREPTPAVPTGVAVQRARASTALDGHPAANAVDGDPATAWTEAAAGPGEEEWVELVLPREVEVRRVLVWNGDQADEAAFAENGRAARIRVEVAGRQFRVDMLDIRGPQGVDLPAGLVADRVRVVVEQAIEGERYTDLSLSEVVVEAAPD